MVDSQLIASFRELASGHGYEVLELIDQGGFGDIFTVRTIASPNSPVLALKRISSRRHVTEDDVILDEIRAMLALRHRHVVRLRDVILVGHVACIVMDLAGLGNLQALLKGGRMAGNFGTGVDSKEVEAHFGEDFVVRTFSQLLSALTFCHARNVAHRDLQPANVLLLSWRRAVLADFGLATPLWDPLGSPVTCRDFLGRDPYLAPEVRGQVPYRPGPGDIWSLGCLLVFLTTRNHPDPQVLDYRASKIARNSGICCEVPSGHICSGQLCGGLDPENRLTSNHIPRRQLSVDHASSDPLSDGYHSNSRLHQSQLSSDRFALNQLSVGLVPSSQHDTAHLAQWELLSSELHSDQLSSVGASNSDSATHDLSKCQCVEGQCIRSELICYCRQNEESDLLETHCGESTLPDDNSIDACSSRPVPDNVSMNANRHATLVDGENIVNKNNSSINVITTKEDRSKEQSDNQDNVLDDMIGTISPGENVAGRGRTLKCDPEIQQAVSDSRNLESEKASESSLCQHDQQNICFLSPLCHPCSVCSSPPSCLSPSLLHLCCRMVDFMCKECPDDRPEADNAEEVWRCAVAALRYHA